MIFFRFNDRKYLGDIREPAVRSTSPAASLQGCVFAPPNPNLCTREGLPHSGRLGQTPEARDAWREGLCSEGPLCCAPIPCVSDTGPSVCPLRVCTTARLGPGRSGGAGREGSAGPCGPAAAHGEGLRKEELTEHSRPGIPAPYKGVWKA